TFWIYASSYGGKILTFISTIILARLLLKEDFGVAGYALVVMNFLDVLSDLGVGHALIYHRDDPEAADTAFWIGQAIGVSLFALTWLSAPLAAAVFDDVRAVPVIRVLALTFPIVALSSTHDALLRRSLEFKNRFIPDLTKATAKGLFSIVLALFGFGAWSLILGQLAGSALGVIAFWWVLPWRPSLRFGRRLARALVSYGTSIVSVRIVSVVLLNADYVFVGRFLGAAALGAYTMAFRIPELVVMHFCNVIAFVIFPVYARLREEEPEALARGFLATTRYVGMVTVPLALGLALVAKPFVLTVFGEKWAETIPVLRAISIYTLMLSLSYNAGDVYKAQGRPSLLTVVALVRAAILVPALWWAATGPGTLEAVGWTHAAVALLSGTFEMLVAARMLHTPLRLVLHALRPAAAGAVLMAPVVWMTLSIVAAAPAAVQLFLSIAVGAVTYGSALWWLQRDIVVGVGHTLRGVLART
ncbi:MAG TPA: lipopolysaccharide biosynthesis protein, partial [Ardenticatenaceae bacterium]|nr:lipopolysaccharide biosynthesis protein [Ardenticatenaceae bacterium]